MEHKIIRQHTLREVIVQNIKELVLKGKLLPGEKVSEPDLVKRYGISRTPIREAFRQLESEGYLTVVPRRGAVVTAMSSEDLREYYEIKRMLEGYAARSATLRLTEDDLTRLGKISDQLNELARKKDIKAFFRTHNEFQAIYLKATGNKKLFEMIDQLEMKCNRLRLTPLFAEGRIEMLATDYGTLLNAFRLRDGEHAEKLVQKMVNSCRDVVLESSVSKDEPIEDAVPLHNFSGAA